MRKIAIFGELNFPRGGATSNYVQYFSLALKAAGFEVVVISPSGNLNLCEFDNFHSKYKYKGFEFRKIKLSKLRLKHYIQFNYLLGRFFINQLENCKFTKDDIVCSYSFNYHHISPVFRWARKKGILTAAVITEFHSKYDFNEGRLNLRYLEFSHTVNRVIPKANYIFPISTFIEDAYRKYNCKQLCLPILADAYEYSIKPDRASTKIRIIYPANGKIKDSLASMLESLVSDELNLLSNIEFHLTGVKKQWIEQECSYEVQALVNKQIILHDWLTYEDLICLYAKMDFMLLSREKSQMTLANFPSKVPEAMCYGVIPIVSRVGDYTKYYLTDGLDSIIFDGADQKACIQALKRAFEIPPETRKKMSYAARKCVEEKFDYRQWVTCLKEFLEC